MKLSNELITGIAIGAAAALLLSRNSTTIGPVVVQPKVPAPKQPNGTSTPQNRIAAPWPWYPRRAYVADLRHTYVMPAWYAA